MSIHNSSALARQANWYWTNINCLLSANAMTTVLPAIIRNAIGRDLLSRRETESSVAYANPFSHACRANNGSTQYRTGGHGLFRVIRRDVKVLMVSVSKALVSLASIVIRHLGCNYIAHDLSICTISKNACAKRVTCYKTWDWQRCHSFTLSSEDINLIRKNFLHGMLY